MQDSKQSLDSIFGEPIHVYSRTHALEDGSLIDITKAAREAGFRTQVAVTSAVWADCVAWRDADSMRQTAQDEAGRLWDVLWMASLAARRAGNSQRIAFTVHRVPRGGRSPHSRPTTLHMCIGPGDDGTPVVTILLPTED